MFPRLGECPTWMFKIALHCESISLYALAVDQNHAARGDNCKIKKSIKLQRMCGFGVCFFLAMEHI